MSVVRELDALLRSLPPPPARPLPRPRPYLCDESFDNRQAYAFVGTADHNRARAHFCFSVVEKYGGFWHAQLAGDAEGREVQLLRMRSHVAETAGRLAAELGVLPDMASSNHAPSSASSWP